ncbi:hypothetical protein BpHYR1_020962 [Brachionus plicatilis]|uniref:Uncharacterized protein n=1 Tax=Brachionus plicatilis TaxID=10195 RepID=A0A3M7PGA1_BRAPC|nr:hypothetical protein BpHYR1_020962 [Brachionus plicatilis]
MEQLDLLLNRIFQYRHHHAHVLDLESILKIESNEQSNAYAYFRLSIGTQKVENMFRRQNPLKIPRFTNFPILTIFDPLSFCRISITGGTNYFFLNIEEEEDTTTQEPNFKRRRLNDFERKFCDTCVVASILLQQTNCGAMLYLALLCNLLRLGLYEKAALFISLINLKIVKYPLSIKFLGIIILDVSNKPKILKQNEDLNHEPTRSVNELFYVLKH